MRFRDICASVVACLFVLLVSAPFCVAADHSANSPWVATWGAAMQATDATRSAPDFSGQTLREIVHDSVGGRQARVWISNRFGSEPLRIGAAHIALSENGSAIRTGSDRALTFHQLASVTIPPGAAVVSDPITMDVPALSNLAVSLYFPGHAMGSTGHPLAMQTSYAAEGNAVGAVSLGASAWREHSWYFLTGVDVYAPGDSAVVTVGDSITDGDHSTPEENHRWPDFLAARLAATPTMRRAGVLGVANSGIDGNRVLLDGWGPNARSRIDRDVLARSGVRYLIVMESINDIGRYTRDHQPYGDLATRLESALAQMAAQAHQHGILVFGATLTPYQGCDYYSQTGEAVRQALNQWIRTSHTFDGVMDFDKATHDPQHPLRFLPQYNSGDDLHPNDAGYRAMANAIDLGLFLKKPKSKVAAGR